MTWQDYSALTLIAAAAFIVAIRAYHAMFGRHRPGCGTGCGSCGSKSPSASKPDSLLSIGPPQRVRGGK